MQDPPAGQAPTLVPASDLARCDEWGSGHIGIMEKNMETAIVGYISLSSGFWVVFLCAR